ncbi:MAG: hypothetical protein ACK4WH_15115 [Phycisphaerales bacterium]
MEAPHLKLPLATSSRTQLLLALDGTHALLVPVVAPPHHVQLPVHAGAAHPLYCPGLAGSRAPPALHGVEYVAHW